jgi:hypothetical protein
MSISSVTNRGFPSSHFVTANFATANAAEILTPRLYFTRNGNVVTLVITCNTNYVNSTGAAIAANITFVAGSITDPFLPDFQPFPAVAANARLCVLQKGWCFNANAGSELMGFSILPDGSCKLGIAAANNTLDVALADFTTAANAGDVCGPYPNSIYTCKYKARDEIF